MCLESYLTGALDGIGYSYLTGALDGVGYSYLTRALDGVGYSYLTRTLDGVGYSYLTGALEGVEYSKPLACPLTIQEEPGFLSYRRLGGPRCRSGQVWKRKCQSHTGVRTPDRPSRTGYDIPTRIFTILFFKIMSVILISDNKLYVRDR